MVAARQEKFATPLKGIQGRRLVVPLYQRQYSWTSRNRLDLWADACRIAQDRDAEPEATHFLGSVVLAPAPGEADDAFLIIDGQQRLLTLSLMLCALRDSGHIVNSGLRSRIASHLTRRRNDPASDPYQSLRIVPTQLDRDPYARVVLGERDLIQGHRVTNAYEELLLRSQELGDGSSDWSSSISVDQLALALLDGLEGVRITADQGDNVHRIFESLNNRGTPLTQADLLRNYVFMRLHDQAGQFYEFTWRPMEALLDQDAEMLTDLFWLDLTRDHPSINRSATYVEQQKRLERMTPTQVKRSITKLSHDAALLRVMAHPDEEHNPQVRLRLARLLAWGSTTTKPIALDLLKRRRDGQATSAEVARALRWVESYLVRRVVVGQATMNINNVLLSAPLWLSRHSNGEHVDKALRRYLSEPGKNWTTDTQLRLDGPDKPFYRHGRANQKKLIFEWINQALSNGEVAYDPNLTIEHVMPQHLTPAWRREFGTLPKSEVDNLHALLLHTIGNLTLTLDNSGLSDRSFANKRSRIAKKGTGLVITQQITRQKTWTPTKIRARSRTLIATIIKEWPGPE